MQTQIPFAFEIFGINQPSLLLASLALALAHFVVGVPLSEANPFSLLFLPLLHLDSRNCRIRFWSPKFTFAFSIESELPRHFCLELRWDGKAD